MTFIDENIIALKEQHLFRQLKTVESPNGRLITVKGKTLLNFCSNNYLGLADDQRLIDGATKAMHTYGFGSGASRLVNGNYQLLDVLENKLAALKKTEAALIFNSGYNANVGVISALMGREDIVFSDKLNHASIVDGIILSRANFKRYRHLDMGHLEEELKLANNFKRRLIVTDTVFSMDGDVAPLKTIMELAKRYDALVMTDDAHGFGVMDLENHADIQMGTLSKAAGSFGAYVCCTKVMRDYFINHARSFIYTTALPAAVVGASIAAVDIIANGKVLKKQLKDNADKVRDGLKAMGFDTLASSTAIIPVVLIDAAKTLAAEKFLEEKGIFVQAIRPPTVPVNTARLRITLMATHTQQDISALLNAMKEIRNGAV